MKNPIVDRRQFVVFSASAGAALVLGVRTLEAWGTEREGTTEAPDQFAPNMWLSVDGRGTVTIRSAKSEMGQGVWTSLPMIFVLSTIPTNLGYIQLGSRRRPARRGEKNSWKIRGCCCAGGR